MQLIAVPQNVDEGALKMLWMAFLLKEELHNRFNLISEERVKIFKHNSENLMKIG